MKDKKWIYLNKGHNKDDIIRIAEQFHIPPIVATILLNRDIKEEKEIEMFLESDIDRLRDPFLLKGMEEAIGRVLEALDHNEKITVYGDYDVDGITSCAILTDYLRNMGAEVDYYIPDRVDEGYGINIGAVDKIAESGTKLIITVDCGITAKDEIFHAKNCGMDVVITDHHQCKSDDFNAVAVVNPNRPDCDYPFKELAGVGVVFKFIIAMETKLGHNIQAVIDRYIDLVALGTIADVVRLVDENRLIVNYGLERIKSTKNIGLRNILLASGLILEKPLTAGAVGFIVAPRINAAGRIGDPNEAVKLFLTKDEDEAKKIAYMLNDENRKRQETEQEILKEAITLIEADSKKKDKKIIVLANNSWHHGVVGIVASRITEMYNKPCILISQENEIGKGSGRSIKGFNLYRALETCSKWLIKYGGHELAAGLTINKDDIDNLETEINKYAEQHITEDDMVSYVNVDCDLPIRFITEQTAQKLSKLEPFGMGNAAPVFSLLGLEVLNITALKDDKHIRLTLLKDNYRLDAFGFNMGKFKEKVNQGDLIDVLFNININIYKGEKNVQLVLKDIRGAKQA